MTSVKFIQLKLYKKYAIIIIIIYRCNTLRIDLTKSMCNNNILLAGWIKSIG